jgi:enoyl-[acyl-carrier-protein] reductase (NADH)
MAVWRNRLALAKIESTYNTSSAPANTDALLFTELDIPGVAVELAEHGITANAVSPGPVDTPMTKLLHTAKFKQEYSSAIPMNRYGTVSEVAAAVAFLASEQASYITGISMPVDGGFLASGARGI